MSARPTKVAGRAAAVLTLGLGALVVSHDTSRSAFAAENCFGPDAGRSFVGSTFVTGSKGPITGAVAQIQNRQPALCTGNLDPSSAVSLWSMVAGTGSQEQYAQAGYFTDREVTSITEFAQYTPEGGGSPVSKMGETVTTTSAYYVEYQDKQLHMFVQHPDNSVTDLLYTGYDPLSVWQSPIAAQWDAETLDPGDDVPGTFMSPTYFSRVQDKGGLDSIFAIPGPLNVSCSGPECWRYGATEDNPDPDAKKFHVSHG